MPQTQASGPGKVEVDRCSRCLQPVPPKAKRCPECNQPLHSAHRKLPLMIGAVGLFALAFILVIMFVMIKDEDLSNGPTLVDQGAQSQEQVLHDAGPKSLPNSNTSTKDGKPDKPDKPPPLNER